MEWFQRIGALFVALILGVTFWPLVVPQFWQSPGVIGIKPFIITGIWDIVLVAGFLFVRAMRRR